MKILEKVDPKLVDAFSEALKTVWHVVLFVAALLAWIIIFILSFKASAILGIVSVFVCILFCCTLWNYFD